MRPVDNFRLWTPLRAYATSDNRSLSAAFGSEFRANSDPNCASNGLRPCSHQPVTHAAHRLDAIGSELVAQVADVDVDS